MVRSITSKLQLPRAIGHRGLAARAPENTLAGMRCAQAHHFAWVEFDVQLSHDGVPIVLHDATLERTTSGSGLARRHTLRELRNFDAGSWFGAEFQGERIPTLCEVLALCETLRLGANVEIKTDPDENAAQIERLVAASLAEIESYRAKLPLLVSSMDERVTELCANQAPHIPRGYLTDRVPRDLGPLLRRMDEWGCVSFHCPVSDVSRELLATIHASHRPLLAFTLKKPEDAAPLFALGVDSVFSDVPVADAALPLTDAT